MRRPIARSVLAVSGVMLLVVGLGVLFQSATFAAANGVTLPENPSVLSEYRAPGGMLTASSVIILLGALRADRTALGLTVSALVYGTYGVSRLVSVALDGMPSAALAQAMTIELVIGAICVAILVMSARRSANPTRR